MDVHAENEVFDTDFFLSMVVFLDGLLNKEHSATTNRKSKLKKKHRGMQYRARPKIAC